MASLNEQFAGRLERLGIRIARPLAAEAPGIGPTAVFFFEFSSAN